jgi:DNA-binding NarL/FixJ family response regulator
MPRMDGLQALPGIRAAVPRARIVVLSGFDAGQVEERAMAAGADAYVEKGRALSDLLGVLAEVVGPPPTARG